MMTIPTDQIEQFLQWTHGTTGKILTVKEHFPMSSKVYTNYHGSVRGMLASQTTIVPGAGKGKDPYWTIIDACAHLVEVSHIFKWVHRRTTNSSSVQAEMYAIFDGSSNHTARALDGLNLGGGVCKGPGGANAPGAPMKDKGSKDITYRMKMRDGWFINKFGKLVVQIMHREQMGHG